MAYASTGTLASRSLVTLSDAGQLQRQTFYGAREVKGMVNLSEPIIGDVFTQQAITEAAIAYRNQDYIARLVAPQVEVDKDSGKLWVVDKANWLRDDADVDRRPGTRAPRGGYTTSQLDYSLLEMAQAHPIPDRVARSADAAIRIYERGSEFCMDRVLLRLERHAAAQLRATGNWGTDNTTATDWDDFSNGDPAVDVDTAKRTVQEAIGRPANVAVMGQIVFDALKQHPDGLDRFKHTQTGILNKVQVAEWLGLDQILVGTATRNTADEGATASMSPVWDDDCLVIYVPPAAALDVPAAAYTIVQRGRLLETKRFREEAEAQDVIEVVAPAQVLRCATDAGYFFSDIV